MKAVLQRGGRFRFSAKGASMSPFIKDGDVLTVIPVEKGNITIGNVIACLIPHSKKLIVHRIVAKSGKNFLVKGDNSLTNVDGLISKEQILGVVARVERENRQAMAGLGIERRIIAYLSKNGLLTRIVGRISRTINKEG